MDFPSLSSATTNTYSFAVEQNEAFGEFTLLKLKRVVQSTSFNGKVTSTPYNEDKVVLTTFFDEQIKNHGSNPEWMLSIPEKHHIESGEAIHPDYLKAYQNANWSFLHEPKNRSKRATTLSLREVLLKHKELLVKDRTSHDHFFYNLHGKRVPRSFYFGWIESRPNSKSHRMKKMLAYMQTHPQVSNVELFEVPSHSSSYSGEARIVFTFNPKNVEEFRSITVKNDSWSISEKIFGLLNFDQFKRQEDDD